jgi:hypothetical protein
MTRRLRFIGRTCIDGRSGIDRRTLVDRQSRMIRRSCVGRWSRIVRRSSVIGRAAAGWRVRAQQRPRANERCSFNRWPGVSRRAGLGRRPGIDRRPGIGRRSRVDRGAVPLLARGIRAHGQDDGAIVDKRAIGSGRGVAAYQQLVEIDPAGRRGDRRKECAARLAGVPVLRRFMGRRRGFGRWLDRNFEAAAILGRLIRHRRRRGSWDRRWARLADRRLATAV